MKTISIINLKCGVAKTLTTISMAYALSQTHNARILVVDNDKQGKRADRVHAGIVAPYEDNMLAITTDGRKLALDQRVIDPSLPDEPGSELNMVVNNVYALRCILQVAVPRRGASYCSKM